MRARRASGTVAGVRPTRFARLAALVLVTAAAAAGIRAVVAHGDGGGSPGAPGGAVGPTRTPTARGSGGDGEVTGLPSCRNSVLPAAHAGYGQWRTTLLDTTPANNTTYYYRVDAVDQAGNAAPSSSRSINFSSQGCR